MTQTEKTLAKLNHWIDGKAQPLGSTRTGDVFDPATGEVQLRVAFADASDADRVVESARSGFAAWRRTPVTRRAQVLFRYREILDQKREELARAISSQHGKTLPDARGEVQRGIEVVEFACGIPQLLKGEHSHNVSTAVDSYSVREPLGVVAGITPFNFPAMVPMWMYPVAVACGNSFVLKPSEKDPGPANLMAEWFTEAGLPDGVFNVLHGDRVAVEALLDHRDIAAVSFVGSTPIARHIYETASKNGKRVQALGGAKNHMVVLPDADFDMAADAAVSAGYGSAGERCMAISVVVTVGDAADQLLPRILDRAKALHTGSYTDERSEMGPLITRQHCDSVIAAIDKGASDGADLILDGRQLEIEGDGFFVGPTLFDQVTPSMELYQKEVFGPVLSVVRCDTFKQAIELINSNPYANGTAIFTHDGGAARQFQDQIEVGMVGINVPIPVPLAFYSFGGWRDSLFGTHSVYGGEGVSFYTRPKVITSRWPDPSRHQTTRGVDLGFPTAE